MDLRNAWWWTFVVLVTLVGAGDRTALAQAPRFEFTRMIAHWDAYGDPRYLEFVDESKPEVAQIGFYGAHFWSLAHTEQYAGYPAHFPVRGLRECGDWFAERNRQLHARGVKVVGHFNVEFLVGDPDGPKGPTGFFHFYRNLWDERELGPKPVADPTLLLERDADGKPLVQSDYGIGGMKEYWACLRNPQWQQVLKAWLKRGVERGVDGYVANYFYRHNCLCEHCQRDFRAYLRERFTAEQLRERFDIADLDRHVFAELVSWHDPKTTTPLRLEMLRFSQVSNKRVFDDLFVRYGRSLKPDLIVAQWNHLGDFSQVSGDERCLLPSDLWGKDETYLWYSTGGSAFYTDLANRFLGDGTLQARYIRGAFDDKPFTLGKYEGTRIRSAIAELAANGGAPMGFYTRFTDPAARAEIGRYYQFLARHDALFRACRPSSEVALLFPRRAIHAGQLDALDRFRHQGRALLEAHVLFDVVPDDFSDDAARQQALARYRHVVDPSSDRSPPPTDSWGDVSRFKAPFTVRVAANASADGKSFSLHFVNYNRQEPPLSGGKPSAGGGIQDEKPIAVKGVAFDWRVPVERRVAKVEVITPEMPEPRAVEWRQTDGRIQGELPEFLVYGVVKISCD